MNDFKLRQAVFAAAIRVQHKGTKFPQDSKMWEANTAAMSMFASDTPLYVQVDGKKINIRFFAMRRINRYMRRKGLDWSDFSFDAIVQWFIDNWEEILKVLISLLMFI